MYYITDTGRHYFAHVLRETVSSYTPGLSSIDACLFFLHHVSSQEAVKLLHERYHAVEQYRQMVQYQIESQHVQNDAHQLVNDHKLTLLNAELRWLERTIAHLQGSHLRSSQAHPEVST